MNQRVEYETCGDLKVERRKINYPPMRLKIPEPAKEVKIVEIYGRCTNQSSSGEALQLTFQQFRITRVWLPRKFCELHEDGTTIVKLPQTFRSRLDASQQVRVAKLIRLAINNSK